VLFVSAACSDDPTLPPTPAPSPSFTPGQPYAYEPAPPEEPTPIDGVYARRITFAQAGGPPASCRRCAPYRLDPGRNRLELREGRFYATYEPGNPNARCPECKDIPGFRAVGHYKVSGDRIEFFNDAECIRVHGIYQWTVKDGMLRLEVVDDPCPFVQLRAKFFTRYSWRAVE
jgi:hypothetical protein